MAAVTICSDFGAPPKLKLVYDHEQISNPRAQAIVLWASSGRAVHRDEGVIYIPGGEREHLGTRNRRQWHGSGGGQTGSMSKHRGQGRTARGLLEAGLWPNNVMRWLCGQYLRKIAAGGLRASAEAVSTRLVKGGRWIREWTALVATAETVGALAKTEGSAIISDARSLDHVLRVLLGQEKAKWNIAKIHSLCT